MKKSVGLKMEEDTHRDLKLLSAMEGRSMADLIEEMVAEKMRRARQVGKALPVVFPESTPVESYKSGPKKGRKHRKGK